MNLYFISLLNSNDRQTLTIQSGEVFERYSLLEEVRDATPVKGRIIGFDYNSDNQLTPIVACYNGQIRFFAHVQKYPATHRTKEPQKLKADKAPIIFIFSLNELQGFLRFTRYSTQDPDKTLRNKFNIFFDSLGDHPRKVKVITGNEPADCRFIVTVNAFKIDCSQFLNSSLMKKDKEQIYGNILLTEYLSFLKNHLASEATITAGTKNPYLIMANSALKKQILWLPKSIYEAFNAVAAENNQSVSLMLSQWLKVAGIELRSVDSFDVIKRLASAAKNLTEEDDQRD